MKAVVLAAGRGERLQPLTLTRPKVLLPVANKPLLQHLLEALRRVGVDEVLIVVHYMAEKIMNRFGDGSDLDLKIEYVRQPRIYGTADAIGMAEGRVDGEFLAVYGDLFLTPEALEAVINRHRKNAVATLALVPVENPSHYGMVRVEGEHVKEIVEKPESWSFEPLANAGVYVFDSDIFDAIRRTGESTRGEREITDTIQSLVDEGQEVRAVEISRESWLDVGRPWDLLEANRRAVSGLVPEVKGRVEEGATLVGPVYVAEDARIRAGAYIEGPAVIGGESDIGPNCYIRPCTSIGSRVRIGNACEIKNSIVMNGTHIGHLSYVGDSIIGENCNLGAGTITANLRFDKANIKMVLKGQLVDSGVRKFGVVMGDGSQTGINALTMPGVKIGPGCWIGPGVVVYRDVAPNTFLRLRQELVEEETPAEK